MVKEMTISPKSLKLAILISLWIGLLMQFSPTTHLLFFIFMLAVAAIYVIRERRQITKRTIIRLAPATACVIVIVALSLWGYHLEKGRHDQFWEQCITLGGMFNPGEPPAILRNGAGKPPTCTP